MGVNVIYAINDSFRVKNDEEEKNREQKKVEKKNKLTTGTICLSSILYKFFYSLFQEQASTMHRRKIQKEIEKKN